MPVLDSITTCFGLLGSTDEAEREPLLPRYNDDTVMQTELRKKLHSYQMYRALSQGYMPSTEQVIVNLRTLLSADLLNADNPELSPSGCILIEQLTLWLQQFIKIFQEKNRQDQIQDFIWYLSKPKVNVDVGDISRRASKAQSKAQTAAALRSIQTVGSLLLTNSDFRLFLADLGTVGREVFKDTAFTLSKVAEDVGQAIEPPKSKKDALKEPGADADQEVPSADELQNGLTDAAKVVGDGANKVAATAGDSIATLVAHEDKDTLLYRLKQAVLKLRKRNDYTDSVSTITLLFKRYAMVYSRAVQETVDTAEQDVQQNKEMDMAIKNFWLLLTSLGDKEHWEQLEKKFHQVLGHKDNDPEFENLTIELGNAFQDLLTDPSFFDDAEERFKALREKSRGVGTDSSLRNDIDALLDEMQQTFHSVMNDTEIQNMVTITAKVLTTLSPSGEYVNGDLLSDSLNVFVPLLIKLVQYIAIPRLEVSTPEIDLLLENLILEPGRTVNHSSFLPYRFKATTQSDLEIRRTHLRTITSSAETLVTLKLDGMTVRASDLGFWLRAHPSTIFPLFPITSAGIASFALENQGLDVHVDIAVGRDRLEHILSLSGVRAHVHSLDYHLHKSRLSIFLNWLTRPIIRPILRKVIEQQISQGVAAALHAANRELVFARERLRATRVADPQDVMTFVRAVAARLAPEDDPDLYTRVGVDAPGKGVFKNRYAPGSVVKLWKEEAERAGVKIERGGEWGGWRNDVFDVPVSAP